MLLDSAPFRRGKCCPFFIFWFFVSGSVSFVRFFCRFSLLRVAIWKNFRERTFVFGCRCWSCVFGGIVLMFLLYLLAVRSRNCLEKFSWCQVLCFWDFSLYFRFFVDVVFACVFSRDKAQVVTGHPHTHLFSSVLVLLFLSRRAGLSPFFGRASCFLAFSRGAILGPASFWDSPGTYGAWARSPLPRPFFGREAAWVFLCFLCLVVVFPLLFCFAASHNFTRRPANGSTYGRPGALDVPPLARVRARGCPSRAEGWSPPCDVIVLFLVFGFGSQGPRRIAPRAFCL